MTMMGKERILIVGTDYDIQELHDYFSSKGYRVFVASNIVEGTRLHKKYRPRRQPQINRWFVHRLLVCCVALIIMS